MNQKNLNYEIETQEFKSRCSVLLSMNQKNLNYEIETQHPDWVTPIFVVLAMNQKNLNYEIETNSYELLPFVGLDLYESKESQL